MMIMVYFLAIAAFIMTLLTGFFIGLLVDQAFMHQYLKDLESDSDLFNVTIEDIKAANEEIMKSDFTYND